MNVVDTSPACPVLDYVTYCENEALKAFGQTYVTFLMTKTFSILLEMHS